MGVALKTSGRVTHDYRRQPRIFTIKAGRFSILRVVGRSSTRGFIDYTKGECFSARKKGLRQIWASNFGGIESISVCLQQVG